MKYEKFKDILNKSVFNDTTSKADLLEKIAENPSRYIGLFRPTLPKLKLLQNLTQSQEIRFGDAFENLITEYLTELGFVNLEKKYVFQNEKLNIDQCFRIENKVYFVEQKIRDDHDSTKKRGQFSNFLKKVEVMLSNYKQDNLEGFMFFIDPELTKNKKYYETEMKNIPATKGIFFVCYGKDFFKKLGFPETWDNILDNLEQWRKEIPEEPELNFDLDADISFEQIKNISISTFKKLFDNQKIWKEIILTLFPERKVLGKLLDFFETQKDHKKYKEVFEILQKKLNQ